MLAFWIFAKDFKIMIRDKQTFIVLIAMPLLLIAILGAALSGVVRDNTKNAELSLFNVAVIDLDQSKESTLFVDDILIARLSSIVHIQKIKEAELEEKFNKHNLTLALIIPTGFGKQIETHQTPNVKLISKGEASIEKSIITISLLHYQNVDLGVDSIVENMTRMFVTHAEQTGESPEMSGISANLAKLQDGRTNLRQTKTEQNARMGQQTVDSFSYYAVAMSVMFILITVNSLVGRMLTEKEDPVYLRQFVSNITTHHYLLGKFFGIVSITFLQLLITVLGSRLLYKVDWGESIISILLTMLIITISTAAIGVFLASFIDKSSTYTMVGTLGTQILAALGGSFVPIYMFPDWMVAITTVLPNALGLRMFLEIMTGGTLVDIWQQGVIAITVSFVLFFIAWIKLSRKGGEAHV